MVVLALAILVHATLAARTLPKDDAKGLDDQKNFLAFGGVGGYAGVVGGLGGLGGYGGTGGVGGLGGGLGGTAGGLGGGIGGGSGCGTCPWFVMRACMHACMGLNKLVSCLALGLKVGQLLMVNYLCLRGWLFVFPVQMYCMFWYVISCTPLIQTVMVRIIVTLRNFHVQWNSTWCYSIYVVYIIQIYILLVFLL